MGMLPAGKSVAALQHAVSHHSIVTVLVLVPSMMALLFEETAWFALQLYDWHGGGGAAGKDAVADAWRRVIRKEQSMLIALAAARTGSGHLVVELVMPFVAGRRLGDAPFYAY